MQKIYIFTKQIHKLLLHFLSVNLKKLCIDALFATKRFIINTWFLSSRTLNIDKLEILKIFVHTGNFRILKTNFKVHNTFWNVNSSVRSHDVDNFFSERENVFYFKLIPDFNFLLYRKRHIIWGLSLLSVKCDDITRNEKKLTHLTIKQHWAGPSSMKKVVDSTYGVNFRIIVHFQQFLWFYSILRKRKLDTYRYC